jgi:hypothetical protein
MTEAAMKEPQPKANAASEKRPYRQPTLRVFGKLHLRTQGTGGTKGDGALGMTRVG